MPTNNFLSFASAAGANVWSDATYAGSSQQQTGIQTGIVPSGLMSKAWRQSAASSAVMGQIITAYGLVDAVDDGNIAGLTTTYRAALAAMLAGTAFAIDQSATANVITASLDPVPPTISTYRGVFIRVANTNTGATTLALNSLGAKGVVRKSGLPLVGGDITAGQFVHFIYDLTAGQWVLAGLVPSDIVAIITSQRVYSGFQPFTSSGTFTVPAGVTLIKRVQIWGAGGGGGGGANNGGGSGGNGGGYASKTNIAVTPNHQFAVTVGPPGSGGNGASNGTAGGTTSFGSLLTAPGGGGGNGGNGTGGAINTNVTNPVGGDENFPGVIGSSSIAPGGNYYGGQGGASPRGGGNSAGLSTNGTGSGGNFPGGGGAGTAFQGSGAATGGAGAGGYVYVEYGVV